MQHVESQMERFWESFSSAVVLSSIESHKLKKPFPSCPYLLWTLTILKAEMKFNKHYEGPLKAKATRCPGLLAVTWMLNYKGTIEKQQVQKQAKPLSGLTWQQIPGFIQRKMNFLQRAGNSVSGLGRQEPCSSYCNQCGQLHEAEVSK